MKIIGKRGELTVYLAILVLGVGIIILHQGFNFEFSAFARWCIRLIINI